MYAIPIGLRYSVFFTVRGRGAGGIIDRTYTKTTTLKRKIIFQNHTVQYDGTVHESMKYSKVQHTITWYNITLPRAVGSQPCAHVKVRGLRYDYLQHSHR